MASRASSASPTQLKVSAMTKFAPASAAHITCFGERRPDGPLGGRTGLVDICITQVACYQRARFAGYPGGDGQSLAVERLKDVLFADDPQLLAVTVVGECLHDIRPGVHELTVQLFNYLGVVQYDL